MKLSWVALRPILFFSLPYATDAIISSCDFLSGAPIVDIELPSLQHTLKFLGVEAKVYRHVLSAGSTPRLRFIRYSSAPIVDIIQGSNEVLITSEGTSCVKKESSSSSPVSKPISTMVVTALLASFASTQGGLDSALGVLAATLLFPQIVSGQEVDSDCTPVLEVVLEAPPYYMGSVAECRAEVENPDHCPEDFPEYPQCSDPKPSCKLAVVGAGAGGLYTAMRLVDEGVFEATDVCVFEATERVGGRIYSLRGFGPDSDLTVDAGAYRTWPNFTPTTHALITEVLGLKMSCYEEEEPCLKYNIVDDNDSKIGFATFVETMMTKLIDQGACFYPRHELVSLDRDEVLQDTTLYFANGVIATATDDVILNIPQRPLLKVFRKSNIPFFGDALEEEKLTYDSMHSVQTEIVTKLYLYYEDAWWYKLGLYQGDFEKTGDARNMLLSGRYHDGHVKCKDEENKEDCHGFLLAVYSYDFSGTKSQYFQRFQRDRPEPVTIISNTDIEGAEFLKHAHEQMKQYHLYENLDASYSGFEGASVFDASKPPEYAVLATWNIGTFGAGGGWHKWTELDNLESGMKPLNRYRIHVINEAFSKLQSWAEGSLLLADEVLEEFFGVGRMWDFDAPDTVQSLAQTSSQECAEVDFAITGGGGGGVTADASAPGGGLDPCFTRGALVEMADGTLVPIEQIKEGDIIATGIGGDTGRVTAVLAHDVNPDKPSDVVVIATSHGDLVGTPTHPVFLEARWMELQDAMKAGMMGSQAEARMDQHKVDVFYNLEIDGDNPGISSHSYVVNGVVASGLGDNEALNTLFPRQSVWKQEK